MTSETIWRFVRSFVMSGGADAPDLPNSIRPGNRAAHNLQEYFTHAEHWDGWILLEKSLPLSSTGIQRQIFRSIIQMASIPSSGYSALRCS